MFYDRILCQRQNLEIFSMAWVASTRGVKVCIRQFGLEKIREIKITILSQETMELMMRSSSNLEERLSLKTAVHFIEGTIKIFHEQVTWFQDDLFRYYTLLTTIPKQISTPKRKVGSTQRTFRTPPTPVIKEKVRRKRVSTKRVEQILEDFLGEEASKLDIIEKTPRVPSAVEARRESIEILEPQPIQVALPEEMFGEFDVGPTEIPKDVPPKPPSEASVKSQLERIEEILVAEYQESMQKQTKKSSSSSADQGFDVIQVIHQSYVEHVEEITKQKKPREKIVSSESSNGLQEAPKQILVEAMIHASAEPQEALITQDQPPSIAISVPVPTEAVEEIRSVQEIAPLDAVRTTRRTPREGREQSGKDEMIAKRLRLKFRAARRVLLLDDYNKTVVVRDDFPITIFSKTEFLYDELLDFLMQTTVGLESMEKTIEQMRGVSSSISYISDLRRRLSKAPTSLTPVEFLSKLDSNIPSSVEVMKELNLRTMQSTPFRGDDIPLPQVKLYEETKIDSALPTQETIEVQKKSHREDKTILDVAEKESEQLVRGSHTDELSPRKREEARIKKNIKKKMENLDSQEYILFDDVIPEPKTRINAAKTFFLLLTLVKEQIVTLLPEENSLEVKYVKKGIMLL